MTNDVKDCIQINYAEKLAEIKWLFRIWIKRQITPLGRIAVLKSLILSKLIHLWLLLPNPPDDFFQSLQALCYRFIWQKKPDKINRKTAHKSVMNGGMGLPELQTFASSLKLSWLRKFMTTKHKWKFITLIYFPRLNDIQTHGPEFLSHFNKSNRFWTDVFQAYRRFFYCVHSKNSGELLSEPVFYNNKIQIAKSPIKDRTCTNKGIFCIAHFLLENGQFMSYTRFKEKYELNINFVTFYGYRAAIANYLRSSGLTIEDNKYFDTPVYLRKLMSAQKGCRVYYDVCTNNGALPKSCLKWNNKLNVNIDWDTCFFIFTQSTRCGYEMVSN